MWNILWQPGKKILNNSYIYLIICHYNMSGKFVVLLYFLVLISCNSKKQITWNPTNTTQTDSFKAPKITRLADLPNALLPKTVALDTMPAPITVAVPTRSGGSYTRIDAWGNHNKIDLTRPVVKPLPVLRNDKGQPIRDGAGNSFVMGDGGMSGFTNFTTENGLALDAVLCSFMDHMGNLWFGTPGGGVSRYDGKGFVTFSTAQGLAQNNVSSIAEDKKGNLWFGTERGGVSRYDGKTFTTFTTFTTGQGLANNSIKSIAEDKTGHLWFATDGGGVSRFEPASSGGPSSKRFATFTTAQKLAGNIVLTIAGDKKGNLWFGTLSGGVSRFDGHSFETISTARGLPSDYVYSILEDSRQNLWFGSAGRGVFRLNKRDTGYSFTGFSVSQGLANENVMCIAEDKAGNLWFGTEGGGVSRYSASIESQANNHQKDKCGPGHPITSFSTAQGLINNKVYSITVDKSGNLWFGANGGISRYEGQSIVSFSSSSGLSANEVRCIAEDHSGNLWFGTTGGGACCYDGKSFTAFSPAQGLTDNTVRAITVDKAGNIWFATRGGVSRYDGKSFTSFSPAQGLPNRQILCIAEDKQGYLWFGTNGGGVVRYDGNVAEPTSSNKTGKKRGRRSFTTFTTAQGLAGNSVFSLCEDKSGNIWLGTLGGGVSCYNGQSFTNFSVTQGLSNNIVYCIAEDKTGNIWLGTDDGLNVMAESDVVTVAQKDKSLKNRKYDSGKFFNVFRKSENLPDNTVTQVLQMPDGKMAVGTNLGIALFNPSGDLSKLNNIEVYNSNTCYPIKDINTGQKCMFLDSKGIIWAGTGSEKIALVRFDPSAVFKTKEPPTLIIKGVKINETPICWNDLKKEALDSRDSNTTPAYITEEVTTMGRKLTEKERDTMQQNFGDIQFDSIRRFYPVPEHLVLPYRNNNITFDFNVIETGRPKLVKLLICFR